MKNLIVLVYRDGRQEEIDLDLLSTYALCVTNSQFIYKSKLFKFGTAKINGPHYYYEIE